MKVAVTRLTLRLHDNRSLKGKRHVVRSLIDRIRHRFEASVAEVGDQDLLKTRLIGIAVVSEGTRHASEIMDRIVEYAESQMFEADIIDIEREVIDLD
jgi:uncharacterized protein YlxP (DUF503 family)|tara:strand:- start:97 stop:390 length:294 start_codon:yes stop_codon:yes gene_type:complete